VATAPWVPTCVQPLLLLVLHCFVLAYAWFKEQRSQLCLPLSFVDYVGARQHGSAVSITSVWARLVCGSSGMQIQCCNAAAGAAVQIGFDCTPNTSWWLMGRDV